MAAILDHIHMGCTNVYTTAFDLTKTTRIGHYDGGFTGNITIGQKTMPLGGSTRTSRSKASWIRLRQRTPPDGRGGISARSP